MPFGEIAVLIFHPVPEFIRPGIVLIRQVSQRAVFVLEDRAVLGVGVAVNGKRIAIAVIVIGQDIESDGIAFADRRKIRSRRGPAIG